MDRELVNRDRIEAWDAHAPASRPRLQGCEFGQRDVTQQSTAIRCFTPRRSVGLADAAQFARAAILVWTAAGRSTAWRAFASHKRGSGMAIAARLGCEEDLGVWVIWRSEDRFDA